MLIQEINLNQFRNYIEKNVQFNKGLNIIVGNNGVGKTNILESIIFLSNTKSFRIQDDKKMINSNFDYGAVEAKTDQGDIKAVINEKGKTFYLNGEIIKKLSDIIGKLYAIIFKPGDIELFCLSPKTRRKEIDIELSKISSNYLKSFVNYNHYLKQKNCLLKEKPVNQELLEIINDSLVPVIEEIIKERENFINNINKYISDIYEEISGNKEKINIIYNKCSDINDVFINMKLSKEKDVLYQHSTFGPHKDDYVFMINDNKIDDFASQGQKRMIIISLKLSIVKYIKETTNKDIIILLDDVLSELDKEKSTQLLNMLPDNQIIMTTTHINDLNINRDYKLIKMEEQYA